MYHIILSSEGINDYHVVIGSKRDVMDILSYEIDDDTYDLNISISSCSDGVGVNGWRVILQSDKYHVKLEKREGDIIKVLNGEMRVFMSEDDIVDFPASPPPSITRVPQTVEWGLPPPPPQFVPNKQSRENILSMIKSIKSSSP